ncbi:MAG: PspA/IM30 family protein [Deltaproteobacteria bacterium]|nr:PspA/IM30 family protein [Deltaproteobacteria bacterium]
MGILGRINRVIKGNINEVLDKMSDPAKEVDLLISEMADGLKQAKEEVIGATASAKRNEMHAADRLREVERWQGRAEQAVQSGDDQLAREALGRKMTCDRELELANRAVAEQRGYVDELKTSLKALEARLQDVKLRKESIKQRARAAKDGEQPLKGGEAATEAKFARLEREKNPEVEDELSELKRRIEEGK